MKEPDYVMTLMSTYGELTPHDDQHFVTRVYDKTPGSNTVSKFQYFSPISNHFLYRNSVDDHNNIHQIIASIEGTWKHIVGITEFSPS